MTTLLGRFMAFILLICAMPVILLTGLILAFVQGQPLLFRQARAGKGGVPFTLVKFRTMKDTRDADGKLLPDEMRVTGFGTFLRRSRLDELPSLWNVVIGDIAFIGPRPLLPETIASLGPAGVRRGLVLPGLTGWSQINGNTLLTLDQKIALDLWYVENRSLRTDCMILLRTLWVMSAGEKIRPAAGKPH